MVSPALVMDGGIKTASVPAKEDIPAEDISGTAKDDLSDIDLCVFLSICRQRDGGFFLGIPVQNLDNRDMGSCFGKNLHILKNLSIRGGGGETAGDQDKMRSPGGTEGKTPDLTGKQGVPDQQGFLRQRGKPFGLGQNLLKETGECGPGTARYGEICGDNRKIVAFCLNGPGMTKGRGIR